MSERKRQSVDDHSAEWCAYCNWTEGRLCVCGAILCVEHTEFHTCSGPPASETDYSGGLKWIDHGSVRHPEDFTECPVCRFIERFPESMEPALAALPETMKRTPAVEGVPTTDQRALLDQLEELAEIAGEYGMYDAADWLRARLAGHDQ